MPATQEGFIISGDYCGWQIIIDDDREGSTGGYFIYIKNQSQTFDYWFDNEAALKNQLSEFNITWSKT